MDSRPVRTLLAGVVAAALTLSACSPDRTDGGPTGTSAPTAAPGETSTATAPAAPTTTTAPATSTGPATTATPTGERAGATTAPGAAAQEPDQDRAGRPKDTLPDGAVTALLLGTDSRTPGAMDGNADAIMLAQLSADRQQLALVSITRDSWVEIPGLGEGKINSAFARGGTPTMRETVSDLFGGLEIDYVVQTDFEGFISMTRALDGFTVDNEHASSVTIDATGRVVDFPEGETDLENTDGLIYVRERMSLPLGDLDRTERQRAAVAGMLERIGQIAPDEEALQEAMGHLVARSRITGDLDLADALALAELTRDPAGREVVSLMAPITGFGTIAGQSVNLVDEERTAELGAALRAGDVSDYVAEHGTGYAP